MTAAAAGLAQVLAFYADLTPDSLPHLGDIYAPDARFKDPFNEVVGVAAIENIFRHMYHQVQEPRFHIRSSMAGGDEAWLEWEFRFRFRGWREADLQCVRGATRLLFQADGRVLVHRDYWDSGEELLAKLPLLGALIRLLRRRLGAPPLSKLASSASAAMIFNFLSSRRP